MPWSDPALLTAAFILLVWIGAAVFVMPGNRRLRRLTQLRAPDPAVWPRVSVVIAARNEATTVGRALPTLFALDYPDLEFIAVNDRSEDATGAILNRLAADESRLRVVHVSALPPGWIGKNHALHLGAAQAAGQWILFTDADVHFLAPDVLRRTIAYAQAQSLDHLTAVPSLSGHGHGLGICVNAFSFAFSVWLQPWLVRQPRRRAHAGVGAFNLVRTAAYRKLGGHAPLRLRPDDDIKLGKLMKTGGPSEFVLGAGALEVEWYDSVGGMIRGMMKNAYAGGEYRCWLPSLAAGLTGLLYLWPLAALALTASPVWWLYAASVALMLLLGCDQTRFTGGRWWHGLLLPLGMAVFAFIILRSQWVTHRTGGITWRGTHYALRDLKASRL